MRRIVHRLPAAFACLALLALSILFMPALCASESAWTWIGPWHLDETLSDLTAFADLYPGCEELAAGMELRSNGQISWFIGTDGAYGTYVFDDGVLHASVIFDGQQEEAPVELCFVPDEQSPLLEMQLGELTVFWRYGDREDDLPK